MLKPEDYSDLLAALLRKCEIVFDGTYSIQVHAPDHTAADLIHSRIWEFAMPQTGSISILVDGVSVYSLAYYSYFAAYSVHVEPVAQTVPIEAIAAHIPPTYATNLEGCTIFTHDGWLHIRSKDLRVFDVMRGWEYYAPVLRDLGCHHVLFIGIGRKCANLAPHGEPFSLDAVEKYGQDKIESQKAELQFGALKDSLPDEIKAALGAFSACLCCAPLDTITIHFSDGVNWHKERAQGLYKLKPLETILSALPWLADADQYGFNNVKLIEVSRPGESRHHHTFSVKDLKDLRRANLARSFGF